MINYGQSGGICLDGIYFQAEDPIPCGFVVVDCVNGIIYTRVVPTVRVVSQGFYNVVDCVNGIIYYSCIVSLAEYDGQFGGIANAPQQSSTCEYDGVFNGIANPVYLSAAQYQGIFSGSALVSQRVAAEYDGIFSGSTSGVSSALAEYDGIFSGICIPPANVASEACITGPGNPVIPPTANLMF